MHILLIHQAFAAINEAGGTRHHELALQLANKGHQVTVITSSISYLTGKNISVLNEIEKHNNKLGSVKIIRVFSYQALHKSFFHRTISFFSFMVCSFLAALKVDHLDLVWGTSPPIFQGFTTWLVSRLKKKPFLFEIRDLWPAFAVQIGILRNPLLIKLSEWLEKFLYQHADHLIVNSPGYIDHVKKRGAKHVDLIPNGSDTIMFTPQKSGASFRKQYNLEGKFVVLYAGAFGISNDLCVLLETAKILRDVDDLIFVLVGDGKEKENLLNKAEQMQLMNILFISSTPKNEMPIVLAAADVCIAILKDIPLYATVFPNKVFDYMATAKPVVLAIDGVIRQVVEEADAGIAVKPGDSQQIAQAVQWMIENPTKIRKMGENGRRYVRQNFDRAQIAEQLCDLLERMVTPV